MRTTVKSTENTKTNGSSLGIRGVGAIFLLSIGLALATVFAVGFGALQISPSKVVSILVEPLGLAFSPFSEQESAVLWAIRLPRVVLAILVGGTLGVSGSLMQGLFRNPLAEPSLVGVSAGASIAAACFMIFGAAAFRGVSEQLELLALPITAFCGAIGCVLLVHRASIVSGRTSISTMLLAGIAFNALGFAGLGVLQYIADDQQLRSLTFCMLGSLGGATWDTLVFVAPMMLLPMFFAPLLARSLNLMQLGEAEAAYLGIDIERVKRISLLLVALGVGAAVSVSGMIGFIGLVIPHLIRISCTPDHRVLLPASALLGGLMLLGADLIARTAVIPSEMPVGIVTTLVGAPFFLGLLLTNRQSLRL